MPIDLPGPIDAYYQADKGDIETFARCFTSDAVVKDEGRTYEGSAAIRNWKAETSAKYRYTTEPFASEHKEGKTIITSHLVGDFPGSPIDLRAAFGLQDGKIASLEIF